MQDSTRYYQINNAAKLTVLGGFGVAFLGFDLCGMLIYTVLF
jgi:hypothetical protein